MSVGEILFDNRAYRIHVSEGKIFPFSAFEDCRTFGRIEEFPSFIKEFQGVPLLRIVRCGKYYAAVCLFEDYGHFRGRSGGKTGLYDVNTACEQCAAHKLFNHFAGYPCVLSHYDAVSFAGGLRTAFPEFFTVGVCEFYDVNRGQCISRCAAYGAADAGN